MQKTDRHIAIIGMACRFPGGANSLSEYWQMLKDGVSACREVPPDRWSLARFYSPDHAAPGKTYVRHGGFLTQNIDQFDAAFFGISPREAMLLDPQQRLLLEVVWEALENSGIVPDAIRGSNTGVYVGGFMLDNQIHLLNVLNRDVITTHTAIGSTMAMLSNRLSYTFDLHGPSLTVDTACSSSLVSLHLACQALLQGECELALSGGVNIMLRPEYTIAMSKGGFLSPDALCKAFDASGDGYGRGEGAGIVILKPLDKALRDGDTIRAVILATGVNQDGRTDGITTPNGIAQKELMRKVHAQAGISLDDIQYVEAHGTGTRIGDSVETQALGEELAQKRTGNEALWIGSVKTNLGHLEAASGVAGVIKTVLMLEHNQIPGNLHFTNPRPDIDFTGLRLRVPSGVQAWPESIRPACAAINSFGYGGTNAHAVLQAGPAQNTVSAHEETVGARIFPISAASARALNVKVQQFIRFLQDNTALTLDEIGYSAACRRSHHPYRLGIAATCSKDLLQKLKLLADNATVNAATVRNHPRVAFVYTGMGPQFYGMGADLWQERTVQHVLDQCERIWLPLAGWSLRVLFSERGGQPMMAPEYAQPLNFVLQLALTELARSHGLNPDAMLGHSVGEIAAACASGSLSLEDGLTLVYHRSRLMQEQVGKGMMLAVELSAEEVQAYLKEVGGRVVIAAINSPSSVTLAGDTDAITALHEVLTMEQVLNRPLKVQIAYHSQHMDPLATDFVQSLQHLACNMPQTALYSSVTGNLVDGALQDVGYWWRNAREKVRFADAMARMINDGFNIFVEIGPHPVLKTAIDACLRSAGVAGNCFALQHRDRPGMDSLLDGIGRVYADGAKLDWSAQYAPRNLLALPAYPWDRETLKFETEASQIDRLGSKTHPFLYCKVAQAQPIWEGELATHIQAYLPDHKIDGEVILPGAAFIEMALLAQGAPGKPAAIEGLVLHRTLGLEKAANVCLNLDSESGRFNIYSRNEDLNSWVRHAGGRGLPVSLPARTAALALDGILTRCPDRLDIDRFYHLCDGVGLQYGPAFRGLRQLNLGQAEALSQIAACAEIDKDITAYAVHPTLLDSALQTLLALRIEDAVRQQIMFLPVKIGQIRFQHPTGLHGWCHAKLVHQHQDDICGDIVLYDSTGAVSLELLGLRIRAVKKKTPIVAQRQSLLYKTEWYAQANIANAEQGGGCWLIFCDSYGVGEQLAVDALAHRVTSILVHAGSSYRRNDSGCYEVARESEQDIASLLADIDVGKLNKVVYLWGLDIPDENAKPAARLATGTCDTLDLLFLMQQLDRLRGLQDLALCIATVRSQKVIEGNDLQGAPGQHALLGVGRCMGVERPELRVQMVDLNSRQNLMAAKALLNELRMDSRETEVAFRDGKRYLPRLIAWDGQQQQATSRSLPGMPYKLKMELQDGACKSLEFHEMARSLPQDNEVEVALKFSTIGLAVDGKQTRTSQQRTLRIRGAGQVVALGAGVTDLKIGDEVIVLTPLVEMASHLTLDRKQLLLKPVALQLQSAANLLDVAIAHYALFEIGKLRQGQSILVHLAESAVGLAAIELALSQGIHVFATAIADDRQEALLQKGAVLIHDVSSLQFVDEIMLNTGGMGVDLILSPLSGIWREKSLGLVSDGGRFIDISPRENDEEASLPLAQFERGINYIRIEPTQFLTGKIAHVLRSIDSLCTLGYSAHCFDESAIHAIPQLRKVIDGLLQGPLYGRAVIAWTDVSVPISKKLAAPMIRSDAGYLITGGFSGFGFATLKWLVHHGARQIAVLSRSGPLSHEAQQLLAQCAANGVQILVEKIDVADIEQLQAVFARIEKELLPLRGVIHSAGVIDDAGMDVMERTQVERVMRAKAQGAWNLHQVLHEQQLDFFVSYSSITSLLGNAGQLNYAAANAFLDGLAISRNVLGLAGLSINWGVIEDVGMVARNAQVGARLKQIGLDGIESTQALQLLESALAENWRNCGIFQIDWQRWQAHLAGKPQRRLEKIQSVAEENNHPVAEFRRKVLKADPQDRFQLVYQVLERHICQVLRIESTRVEPESNLIDLGIDSLMAIEISSVLLVQTGVLFRALFIVRGPTMTNMVNQILDDISKNAH